MIEGNLYRRYTSSKWPHFCPEAGGNLPRTQMSQLNLLGPAWVPRLQDLGEPSSYWASEAALKKNCRSKFVAGNIFLDGPARQTAGLAGQSNGRPADLPVSFPHWTDHIQCCQPGPNSADFEKIVRIFCHVRFWPIWPKLAEFSIKFWCSSFFHLYIMEYSKVLISGCWKVVFPQFWKCRWHAWKIQY